MTNKRAKGKNNGNIIPIQDLIFHCLRRWYLFALSLSIASGIAVYRILSTPPQYARYAEILIKESEQGGGAGTGSTFRELGNSKSTANAKNEIKALQSVEIMKEAIRRQHLDIEFRSEGRFYDGIIYVDRPMKITMHDLDERESATFSATIMPDSTIQLYKFTANGEELPHNVITTQLGTKTDTPLGALTIEPTRSFGLLKGVELYVEKKNIDQQANHFCGNLQVRLANEETSVVSLKIIDNSTARATDILQAIIAIYNENWVKESNYTVTKSAEFITNRANDIRHELEAIDKKIALFRGDNKLTKSTKQQLIQEAEDSKDSEQLMSLNNQLELVNFIKSYITQNKGKDIIPSNTGLAASGLEQLIGSYNTKLLERNRLAANSSESSPIVVDYDKDLNAMYAGIQEAIDSYIKDLKKEITAADKEVEKSITKITASTNNEKELQTLIRQQNVKNALYLFLLQKLEETELSKEFSASNNRVLVQPTGSNTPVAPLKKPIIMLSLIIGAIIPFTLIFIQVLTNRKVRGRKDLEELDIPLVGEIPLYTEGKQKIPNKKTERNFIVKGGSRNVINEAFRVMRTNFQFMGDKDKKCSVTIVTSFNPGSGKTFISTNLAAALALKGEKVLVIDGDLRRATASEYVKQHDRGISDYLSGGTNDVDSIIVTESGYENLHFITVGTLPPNPTELLNSERFDNLIAEMKKRYTHIFIDCPPIEIVADTQIIEKNCDRTLFVIRAGMLQREMLDELQDIYDNKRFKGLAMILNGTHSGQGRYSYKYGYSYGYGYGYGYGYHYHSKK